MFITAFIVSKGIADGIEKASKILIRDFGEIEKLQVSKKGPSDFVTNSDLKTERIIIQRNYKILYN